MRQPQNKPEIIIRKRASLGKPVEIAQDTSPPASIKFKEDGTMSVTVTDHCPLCAREFTIKEPFNVNDIKQEKGSVATRLNLLHIRIRQEIYQHTCKK